MEKISLKASERTVLGKKVKLLRRSGLVPAHVFGKGLETEHVSVDLKEFLKVAKQAGETGVIELRIGEEKVRPVMIKGMQTNANTDEVQNIDFYQVDLTKKVTVPVPLTLVGDEPEKVGLGEAIVLQVLSEVSVTALPADLVDAIEVDKSILKEIDDAITVGQLSYDHETLTVLADPEEIVVKLAPAVTAEMEALLEEQAAENAAVAEETAAEEPASAEATTGEEGETSEPSTTISEPTPNEKPE